MTHATASTRPMDQCPGQDHRPTSRLPGPPWYTAGQNTLVFPYVTHRHPAFWERPDAFEPERFTAERAAGRHRFAYFPFGGGPRLCIGNQFALTEAQLVVATILSRYQVQLLAARVTPEALVTLRPRGKLLMTVQRRERQAARSQQEGAVL